MISGVRAGGQAVIWALGNWGKWHEKRIVGCGTANQMQSATQSFTAAQMMQ
jgi:hypothetical protein